MRAAASAVRFGVALVLACAVAASAQDAPPDAPEPAPVDMAALVRDAATAFLRGDEKPFEALCAAIDERPAEDPWIIADCYLAGGAPEVATAFAASRDGPRWEGLAAYVARDDAAADRERALACRDAVLAARSAADDAHVLELTTGIDARASSAGCLDLDSLRLRAVVLAELGRGAEAAPLARAVRERAESMDWVAGALAASMVEGFAAQDPLDPEVLRAVFARAARLAARLGDAAAEGEALANLGVVHGMCGEYAAAVGAFEGASAAYDRAPPPGVTLSDRALLLVNVGEIRSRLGEAAGARVALDRAMVLLDRIDPASDDPEIAGRSRAALASLGSARLLAGDLSGALAAQRDLVRRAEAASDAPGLARAAALLGSIHAAADDWAAALAAFDAAHARFADLGEKDRSLRAELWRGYCLRELGRAPEAVDVLERAIASAEELPDPEVLPNARRELGEARAATGDLAAAVPLLRRALDGALELGQREDAARTRIALSEALLAAGDPAEALEQASAAAGVIPALVRDTAQVEAARARRRWVRCYDAGLRAALALGDASSALQFLEAGRAGALLEGLRGRAAFATAAIAPELLTASATSRRARAAAELALADAVTGGATLKAIATRRAALAAAEAVERDAVARIQRESRTAARVAYPRPVDTATARAALVEHEALVVYRALPEVTVAVVVTRAELRCVGLAGLGAWAADCEQSAEPQAADTASRDAAVARLRAALVEPLALDAAVTRVLVSPDAGLATAPLVLLFPDRACALVPSATALHDLRAAPRSGSDAVLAVGDPVYTAAVRLAALPGTRAEIAALHAPKVALLGAEATPAAFHDALAKGLPWRAVHLACHGVRDPRDPWNAALALSPDAQSAGRVTALEIAEREWTADLVVLSACELGQGRVVDAEGAVGVPQALLIAGARCVLANLWRADDDATQALMKSFYEEWRDGGRGAAEALRVAQGRVRSVPRWEDARFWAGWVLWGAPD